MNTTLAILSIGVIPVREVSQLLTEQMPEVKISHFSLLEQLTPAEVLEKYAVEPGEASLLTRLDDWQMATVSRAKVERDLQNSIDLLDQQGFDLILLKSMARVDSVTAANTLVLEPQRTIPPLVASITDGHRVGVIIPMRELLASQEEKWKILDTEPVYALWNPSRNSEQQLIDAGRELVDEGATVLVLDCPGFLQQHQDVLQKTLDVPVLLSNVLAARLAVELLN